MEDHLRSGESLVLLSHLSAKAGNAVGRSYFPTHVERLLQGDTSGVEPAQLILHLQSRKIGEAIVGQEVSGSVGHESGQVAARYTQGAIGRAVDSRTTGFEIGEEEGFVLLFCVAGLLGLSLRGCDLLVVLQSLLATLLQAQHLLALGGHAAAQGDCEYPIA